MERTVRTSDCLVAFFVAGADAAWPEVVSGSGLMLVVVVTVSCALLMGGFSLQLSRSAVAVSCDRLVHNCCTDGRRPASFRPK
jgi:hypothetical protein